MANGAGVRGMVGLAVASVVLGACGHTQPAGAPPGGTGSLSPPGAAQRSPSLTPTRAASTTPRARRQHHPYSDVNQPPRRAGDFIVTVLTQTSLDPSTEGRQVRQRRTGREFWGEEVRTCVKRSSRQRETVGWKDWRAEGMDGRTYEADPRGSRPLRTPPYPFHEVLSPGQCATGYWLIPVPRGSAIRAIQFAPDDGPVLSEWLTLR